jgi:hypothetical protein
VAPKPDAEEPTEAEEEPTSSPPPIEVIDEPKESSNIGKYIGYAAAAIAAGLVIGVGCYCIHTCRTHPSNVPDGPGETDLVCMLTLCCRSVAVFIRLLSACI